MTGYSAADWLQQHRGIHVELSDHGRLMALITFADTDENIDRLINGLQALTEHHQNADHGVIPDVPHPRELRTETVMAPRDAFLGRAEMVPWRHAVGRISAEMICPLPKRWADSVMPVLARGCRVAAAGARPPRA